MASDILGHLTCGLSFEVGCNVALKGTSVLREKKIGVIKNNKIHSFG